MNINEACNLLGIPTNSSADDVKKAFRKKAAEYHPDRNSDKDAEVKFKAINEAYQLLDKNGTDPYDDDDFLLRKLREEMMRNFGGSVRVNLNGRPSVVNSEPIIVPIEISFETSIIGGKKDITYERDVKCSYCSDGNVFGTDVCDKCKGFGWRTYGNDHRELPCTTCGGTGKTKHKCGSCNGSGSVKRTDSVKISIPPGSSSGMRMILKGMGNYRSVGIYDNVIAVIHVIKDKDMELNGDDVISTVELSLLEALRGTKKKLRTIKGEKLLSFQPKTRHKDTVRVGGYGVPPYGSHIVIVEVKYPDDVSGVIKALESTKEGEPEEILGEQN